MMITKEFLELNCPDLVASVRAEGTAMELARIQSIDALVMVGHEALLRSLKFDGKSTAQDAAMAIVNTERKSLTAMGANGDPSRPH